MARVDARVRELERRTKPPGKLVIADLRGLTPAEAAAKVAAAELEASATGGQVITLEYSETWPPYGGRR